MNDAIHYGTVHKPIMKSKVSLSKFWTFKDCNNCNESIRDYVTTRLMLRNEKDLKEKLQNMTEALDGARNDARKEKDLNNLFRVINLVSTNDKSRLEETSNCTDLFLAQHSQSWDSFAIEDRILYVNIIQKLLNFFTLSISKDRSTIEIKKEIVQRTNEVRERTTEVIRTEGLAKRFKTPFGKMIAGTMKSMKCDEKKALEIIKTMGIGIPDGWGN